MRQIDAANARNAKFPTVPEGISEVYVKGWNDAIDAIVDNAPRVEERPHGKWIYTPPDIKKGDVGSCYCSKCGGVGYTTLNFCPNCGADMREGRKNE